MTVLALAGDIDSLISDIRLRTPLTALAQRTGWRLEFRSFHECRRVDLLHADVTIVQRGASRRAWQLERAALDHGGAVIYEIDDLLTAIAPHLSVYASVSANLPWIERCMAEADLLTVSTPRLGAALSCERRPPSVEVPNYAFGPIDAPLPPADPGLPVSLLVASSDRLAAAFLLPALRACRNTATRLVVVGPPADSLASAGLTIERWPLLPRDEFLAMARALPNPLAVVPLEDSPFAACKSAIKWYDYAEVGIPALCSHVSPYTDVIEDGVTGALVANTAADWSAAIEAAVQNATWRQRIASAARKEVRARHSLARTVDAWQLAITTARARRAVRHVPQPSMLVRARRALLSGVELAALKIRHLNRARLAQRHRRTASKRD